MSPQIVLITGLNGYLAAHIGLIFVQKGWKVRGTLRSESKRDGFANTVLGPYVASGDVELFAVGDLTEANYASAIQGVDAVVHAASPISFSSDFEKDHLAPAVSGTRQLLEAVAKETSIKSLVVTSSVGAIFNARKSMFEQDGTVYDETYWNDYSAEEMTKMSQDKVETNGCLPSFLVYYLGSKTLAEKAAFDIHKELGSTAALSTMCPGVLLGPPIHPIADLTQAGFSIGLLYGLLDGKDAPIAPNPFPHCVDVRDAAEAHYQAVARQATGRFLISSEIFAPQELADIGREELPHVADRFALGHPGEYAYKGGVGRVNNSKSVKELGLTYRPKRDTLRDAFTKLLELEKVVDRPAVSG